MEAGRAGNSTLSNRGQSFNLLAGKSGTCLRTLIDSNNLNSLGACELCKVSNHVLEDVQLIEAKLAVENGLRALLVGNQFPLQLLHEWHGLLHFTELASLCLQLLIIDGKANLVKQLTDKIDVLLLPGGVGCGGVDSNLLRLLGVVSASLTLANLLSETSLSGGYARRCGANVGNGSRESIVLLRNVRERSLLNGLGLKRKVSFLSLTIVNFTERTFLRTSNQMYSDQ